MLADNNFISLRKSDFKLKLNSKLSVLLTAQNTIVLLENKTTKQTKPHTLNGQYEY